MTASLPQGLGFTTTRFLLTMKSSKHQGGHGQNNKQNALEMKQNKLTYHEKAKRKYQPLTCLPDLNRRKKVLNEKGFPPYCYQINQKSSVYSIYKIYETTKFFSLRKLGHTQYPAKHKIQG